MKKSKPEVCPDVERLREALRPFADLMRDPETYPFRAFNAVVFREHVRAAQEAIRLTGGK